MNTRSACSCLQGIREHSPETRTELEVPSCLQQTLLEIAFFFKQRENVGNAIPPKVSEFLFCLKKKIRMRVLQEDNR